MRYDGDEGLFRAYETVEFLAPLYAGRLDRGDRADRAASGPPRARASSRCGRSAGPARTSPSPRPSSSTSRSSRAARSGRPSCRRSTSVSPTELDELRALAVEVAERAAAIHRDGRARGLRIREKSSAADLVTADRRGGRTRDRRGHRGVSARRRDPRRRGHRPRGHDRRALGDRPARRHGELRPRLPRLLRVDRRRGGRRGGRRRRGGLARRAHGGRPRRRRVPRRRADPSLVTGRPVGRRDRHRLRLPGGGARASGARRIGRAPADRRHPPERLGGVRPGGRRLRARSTRTSRSGSPPGTSVPGGRSSRPPAACSERSRRPAASASWSPRRPSSSSRCSRSSPRPGSDVADAQSPTSIGSAPGPSVRSDRAKEARRVGRIWASTTSVDPGATSRSRLGSRAVEAFSRYEVSLALRNREMPLEALALDVTPTGLHYLLAHYDIPFLDPSAWRTRDRRARSRTADALAR